MRRNSITLIALIFTLIFINTTIADKDGVLMWVKQYNQNIGTEGYDICLDSKGQIFITGYLSENGSDIFLLKTDVKGNKIYSMSYGTIEGEKGYDIAISKADNIYVTGYTTGDLDGNINTGWADVFLTKFDLPAKTRY